MNHDQACNKPSFVTPVFFLDKFRARISLFVGHIAIQSQMYPVGPTLINVIYDKFRLDLLEMMFLNLVPVIAQIDIIS